MYATSSVAFGTQRQRGVPSSLVSDVEITYRGRLVLTTAQAAERYGLALSSMRSALARGLGVDPVAALDARTPLYDADQLDRAMHERPGKGANMRSAGNRSAEGDQDR